MEFNGYCVRVDAIDGYGEKIRLLPLCADYVSIVGIKHKGSKGDNPHYHLVVKTDVRDQAFRVRLRKVFDQGSGNRHMSIKPWDGNIDAISYLFHEEPEGELVIQHNVSDETITKARARNEEVQKKMADARQRASYLIEDDLYERYKANGKKPDRLEIATDMVLYALRSNKYVPNDFLLKAMAAKLEFRLLEGDLKDEEKFARRLVSSAYRLDADEHALFVHRGVG